jgi:hypothetical protein
MDHRIHRRCGVSAIVNAGAGNLLGPRFENSSLAGPVGSIANVGKSSDQTTVPAPLKNRGPSDQIDLISPARWRPRNANEFDARIKSPNIY